jgi:phosphomannomutase
MPAKPLKSFKAYDIRGRMPDELNEELVERIGRATAAYLRPQKMVIGHDIRLSSPDLSRALARGLTASGVEVLDLGLCGTEEVYFGTWHLQADGGVMVTASHNPADYNGLKLVREGARPIGADSGLREIETLTAAGRFENAGQPGKLRAYDNRPAYLDHLLTYVEPSALKPLKIVANPGNGCAGPTLDVLAPRLPFEFVKINYEPDGTFPNGIPNPLLPDNREDSARAVRESGADFGIAWDGDFDRCFLFDETGRFLLLSGRPFGPGHSGRAPRRKGHPRPAPGLEYPKDRQGERWGAGTERHRPCLHQGEDAAGKRDLRRRDECPPLLPRLRLLRFRHDPLAAGGPDHQPNRTETLGDDG